jgi:hypothetical protein
VIFSEWQAQECVTLDISVDEHNKIIDVAFNMDTICPGPFSAYDAIRESILRAQFFRNLKAIQDLGDKA